MSMFSFNNYVSGPKFIFSSSEGGVILIQGPGELDGSR